SAASAPVRCMRMSSSGEAGIDWWASLAPRIDDEHHWRITQVSFPTASNETAVRLVNPAGFGQMKIRLRGRRSTPGMEKGEWKERFVHALSPFAFSYVFLQDSPTPPCNSTGSGPSGRSARAPTLHLPLLAAFDDRAIDSRISKVHRELG